MIFKAYDVRGIYPTELIEDVARLAGRAFVAYLQARRIGVSRDMRLSSPSMAAAFIDGAREQGADVVDYGMLGTDMLYFAVCRDGLDGGAQVTASHNPKQYNGMKLVRREAFPLSGDEGIKEMQEMIVGGNLVAFRTSEAAQANRDLNGDGDTLDSVMQIYDLSTDTVISTGQAAILRAHFATYAGGRSEGTARCTGARRPGRGKQDT